ncbi:MAG: B12-binding domain-containing radical SAM protein [Anaerolineae bacterium]
MYSRVLLIAPPSSSYMGAARPPTGLGYLAQTLLQEGIVHTVEDMRVKGRLKTLQARIESFRPDLIGVSIVSFEYKRSFELVRQIKQLVPNVPVIIGGPHVSALKASVLEACEAADMAVIGEGERVLVEVCRGNKPLDQIPGLVHRQNGQIVLGPPPEVILNLDSVPFPRYVGFDMKRYVKEIPLITSRGCPHRCNFCPNSLMKSKFVARSAKNVVDEIEYWYQRGIRQFNVDDDNFTMITDRVFAICDDIERRQLNGLFIRCANGIRADRVNRKLLARMKDVGFGEVGIGADGGNTHVLMDLINKGETIETIEQAIRDAIDVGMRVKLFVILGHPGETMSDIEDSFALVNRYPLLRAQLYNPVPYPGTALYDWIQSIDGFLIQPEDYLNNIQDTDAEPIFETPELPADVRRQILRRARKTEMEVTRRAVERMFGNLPVVSTLAARAFATTTGRWLFFNNKLIRTVVDHLWYLKTARKSKEDIRREALSVAGSTLYGSSDSGRTPPPS